MSAPDGTDVPGQELDHAESPVAPEWWKTLRNILITTGEIALKVLPVLLAAVARANAGQPPGEPQLVMTTGPVEWFVDHSRATVTLRNNDRLNRPVTVTLSPGSETAGGAEAFVIPAGSEQPLKQELWEVIAGGAGDGQVAIEIPSGAAQPALPGE